MFNWFKKRRAYGLGQKAGGMICEEIENHITARVIPASQRFIDVFRERLTTIWDEPPSPPNPRVRLHNEWEIFKEKSRQIHCRKASRDHLHLQIR
jgi:hypothetical protein